ncbi:MAG: photosystem II stability/assembly factor-like uncharacterized protein [Flavobacteriales bacterium]
MTTSVYLQFNVNFMTRMLKIATFFLLAPMYITAQWQSSSLLGNKYSFQKITFLNDSTGFVVGLNGFYDGVVLKTDNNGTNWDSTHFDFGINSIHFLNENTGYFATKSDYCYLYKTINNGRTWEKKSSANGTVGGQGANKGLFVVDTNTIFWGSGKVVIKVENDTSKFSPRSIPFSSIDAIHFFNETTGILAGHDSGLIAKVTTNGGNSWESTSTAYNVYDFSFPIPATGYAVGRNGLIIKTTDGGDNWILQTSGIATLLNAIYCTDNNRCYAVGNNGVILETTNGGNSWEQNPSATTQNLNSIYCTQNSCYAVGDSGVILKKEISLGLVDLEKAIKNSLLIFPNPANNEVTLEYEVLSPTHYLQLSLFDSRGMLVQTMNSPNSVGIHRISIDIKNLSKGLYYCSLQTDNDVSKAKMIITK